MQVGTEPGKICLFTNIIITTSMTDKGDSGSILVNEHNYGVGLSCGGSNVISTFCSLDIVLDQLDVYLVT